MNIKLSPTAHNNAKKAAESQNVGVNAFVHKLLEDLLYGDSFYVIMRPRPDEEKLKAMHYAMNSILNSKEFYGFKMLSKEEYGEASKEAMKLALAEQVPDLQLVPQQEIGEEARQEEEDKSEGVMAPETLDAGDNENTINVKHTKLRRVK